ncbi:MULTISPECIES: acetoacetate decarboxylase family protein [unclassified Anabaena]|uniref:acetoacetate decarboxylase family protein n=1 Tax=unclassified Anabaena TaxID=2619674 RepID=UPI00082D6B76|nr:MULTISPECIES: acetoacetate decarboxylase family protein [unclassified Anabaena]
MPYPLAPWTLTGYAIQTLHIINIERVRSLIPPELNIISLWPSKTIASVYFASYCSGSVLEYNELIVVPAVVAYGGKIGAWISHIYVDNSDSMAGGREIWGLPKKLAEFHREQAGYITVRQANQTLSTLHYKLPGFAWRQKLSISTFSTLGKDLVIFPAECESLLGMVASHLEVPADSAFAQIGLGQPFLTLNYQQMNLQVAAPKFVSSNKTTSP